MAWRFAAKRAAWSADIQSPDGCGDLPEQQATDAPRVGTGDGAVFASVAETQRPFQISSDALWRAVIGSGDVPVVDACEATEADLHYSSRRVAGIARFVQAQHRGLCVAGFSG